MSENLIAGLEAHRDALLEQALKLEGAIDILRNGAVEATKVVEPEPATKRRYAPKEHIKSEIVDELRKHDKPMTNRQLARLLNRGNSTIASATHALTNEDRITLVGKRGHQYLYGSKQEG